MNNAVQVAMEKVRNVLGELIELHPNTPIDWISEYSGIHDIEYVDPKSIGARFLEYETESHKIHYQHVLPKRILFIGGYYLIEEDAKSHWLVGELGEYGYIDCWSRSESLKEALDKI